MRTYLVSAVAFLTALGITDQSVFGLIVSGSHSAITMTWKNIEVCANFIHYS